ncbi:MAG TPA: hypothetical protein VMR14_13395 [Streptosporangiaceae bacterium]|jgi:cytochrome bd-type quinol oxidase subunit 1|nr:hypothetical protein [Streptosporangiaceae bacterium]
MIKSFPQHLVLWLHLLFVAFTIGPVTVAIMSTPRYIRQRDVRIVRYLNRTTFIFALACLGVLIAGEALASMISVASQPWVIVSATLFIVALALLALIIRDQRKAIKALEDAATASVALIPATAAVGGLATAPSTGTVPSTGTAPDDQADTADSAPADSGADATAAPGSPDPQGTADTTAPAAASSKASADVHLASVERGRIAMMGGLVGLIWLVILVLMVWH